MDFVAVGHLTHDRQPDGSLRPGGAAYYASVTACHLGAHAAVVTSVGQDYIARQELESLGILLHDNPGTATTTFENRYRDGQREQHVLSLANPITQPIRAADVLFFGPVMQEVSVAQRKDAMPPHRVCVAGLQGWMRQVSADGLVYPVDLPDNSAFAAFDALFVSEADFRTDALGGAQALSRVAPIVALTQGSRGSLVFVDGVSHPIQPYPAIERDPTGAGDVYAACFACALANECTALDAAEQASRLAARSVEQPGAVALLGER